MSVKVMGAVWDLKLERDQKFVLLAYADHADHDGFSIFPAVSTIAEKTGYSERSVQIITRELEAGGYLIADGQGTHGTNRWRIPISGGTITPMPGGADSAPVQKTAVRGEENDMEGCRKQQLGVNPTSPEPSLTIIKTSIEPKEENSEKEKLWDRVLCSILNDRSFGYAHRKTLEYDCHARSFDGKCLEVSHPDPPIANAMLAKSINHIFGGIIPGGEMRFVP